MVCFDGNGRFRYVIIDIAFAFRKHYVALDNQVFHKGAKVYINVVVAAEKAVYIFGNV